ncbi:hypothetical protein BJV77DRAFT_1065177 [Russula vinacea]|nr:hypothetical protein BJV77DRAFT_1065177 [Russula vinacea]
MATPDPPTLLSTLVSPPSPSPQPTTPLSTDATDSVATDTAAAATTPTAGTDKVDDATKSNTSKKVPYINPERVRTGGLQREKLTEEELAERMARMREQNEKIKQRRLDVAADEDAFKQTQAAERQRQAHMRKTRNADGGEGGMEEAAEEGEATERRRRLANVPSRKWEGK